MTTIDSEIPFDSNIAVLKAASYLTDPVCKVREYFYSFYTLNETCRTIVQKATRIAFLALGVFVCALLTPLTAPFGAALRGAIATFGSKPYVYLERAKIGKALPEDRKITLVSHNQCYMPGGYSITDGQVTPPSDKERMDANIQEIKKLNPDIICLYEVPDICDACYLSSQLHEYSFIIPVAGIKAIGPSSMMYVASKYEIASIEFTPFVKNTEITGKARFSEMGVLSFDIKSQDKGAHTSIISSHLQPSDVTSNPIDSEKTSRMAQMDKIIQLAQKKIGEDKNVIITGDFNQSEAELNAFLNQRQITWLKRDKGVEGTPTWGGDAWCAKLMKIPPSGPRVLDYTFIAGKTVDIQTQIFETDFSGSEFRPKARSDHYLLFSTIILG